MLKTALSLGGVIQRFAFPLFVGIAIGLMVLSRIDHPAVSMLRTQAVDVLAPVIEIVSKPMATVDSVVARVDHFFEVYDENARLRAENERLLHWQAVARQLEAENDQYRDLLSVVAEPRDAFVTARIIGMSSGTFVRTALINAGSVAGLDVGQAVVTSHGMLGRIVEVGTRSARVLLLTDLNSRVPVVLGSNRSPAIAAGDNSDTLSLMFVADGADIMIGDRLMTSGEGGMLPPGLAVGVVTANEDGVWHVTPFVDAARIEHVRVLDYALPGLLPSTREAGATGQLW
ncbi:MAG: rod shape-determining protein MreC [Rhodospirillales bacterium]|nr:rod shape-determining protein MreC [Rhodospirillales bacterium]